VKSVRREEGIRDRRKSEDPYNVIHAEDYEIDTKSDIQVY